MNLENISNSLTTLEMKKLFRVLRDDKNQLVGTYVISKINLIFLAKYFFWSLSIP